ncbi:hypothetical protein GUITHDRAFT_149065 [Guillardia theta CCMP2712]|uniref:Uncharacterized protein n=1 Tax=Guillardia theta (strain CCMP2712) TaxID=905079 RepID=L1I7F0_GUITC|nr:hypothetical protein GUITHDRAFT_149065 [Guillardia theta CCMP2712]EKX31794.1 hypothetical protein GUITHDRAFT_149065 [Guillardia theta CCMP2712]|eukprot:XP_005818774.1 hypothetical protein GUITHDRAFT_149065 [Guillardia theta CCMP2712]
MAVGGPWLKGCRSKERSHGYRQRVVEAWEEEKAARKFDVSLEGGFLPDHCVQRLPLAYEPWERILDDLPHLNRTGQLFRSIERLRCIDVDGAVVACEEVKLFAHSSTVSWERLREHESEESSHAAQDANYVRHPSVPAQISTPLVDVSTKLGLPPVLTAAIDLWNWKLKRNEQGRSSVEALETISSMTGTSTESFFHLIPCAIQARLGPLVAAMFYAPCFILSHISKDDKGGEEAAGVAVREAGQLLEDLRDALQDCKSMMKQLSELVHADVFFHVYRPLLTGHLLARRSAPEDQRGRRGRDWR